MEGEYQEEILILSSDENSSVEEESSEENESEGDELGEEDDEESTNEELEEDDVGQVITSELDVGQVITSELDVGQVITDELEEEDVGQVITSELDVGQVITSELDDVGQVITDELDVGQVITDELELDDVGQVITDEFEEEDVGQVITDELEEEDVGQVITDDEEKSNVEEEDESCPEEESLEGEDLEDDEEDLLLLGTEDVLSPVYNEEEEEDERRLLKRKRQDTESAEEEEEECRNTKIMKVAEVQTEVPEGDNKFYYERLHKLESERRDLVERLLETKEKYLYSEHSLAQSTDTLTSIKEQHDRSLSILRQELAEVKIMNEKLLNENSKMASQLKDYEGIDQIQESAHEELEHSYQQQLTTLQKRLAEFGDADIQLISAQRTILHLRKKLKQFEEEERIISLSKKQLSEHGSLVCRNEVLKQENTTLRQRVGNIELLQYQLQKEREKCSALEEKLQALDEMKVENEALQMKLRESTGQLSDDQTSSSSSSVVVLRYKLLDVQQRELILTKRCGEFETELRVANARRRDLEGTIADLQRDLRVEKEEVRIRNDSIQRLERRLQFISKERDGCVNVLNSYKLDGGADSVIKEQVKELQETVKRQEAEILELEKRNEVLVEVLDVEKKRVVQMNEEVCGAKSVLGRVEEEYSSLRMEKQKLEELLLKIKEGHLN